MFRSCCCERSLIGQIRGEIEKMAAIDCRYANVERRVHDGCDVVGDRNDSGVLFSVPCRIVGKDGEVEDSSNGKSGDVAHFGGCAGDGDVEIDIGA
jgi:hypothetical protein